MSTNPVTIPVPGELGVSGLRHSSGFLLEEFDANLRGRRAVERFREMRDNSSILGASFAAIDLTIRKVEWCVEPGGATDEDKERAAFVAQCLHDMSFSWADTVLEALSCVQYGFAPCEIVYKVRNGYQKTGSASSAYEDGRVGWAKVALRGQETISRWDLDRNGGIHGFWQTAPPSYAETYIPIEKALLFRTSKERNNPEGRSPLRSAYWDYFAAKRLTESQLIGAERDLAGFPVVRVPAKLMAPDASSQEKAAFEAYKKLARDTRRGDQEGVVLPSDRPDGGQHYFYDFSLLTSGGKREFNVGEMIQYRTRMVAVVLLTDMLLMGHEKVGSYGLAEAKTSLFDAALDGYLQAVSDPFNQHAIPRLMLLNGWPASPRPVLKHKPITPENLAALADFLQKLVAAKLLTPEPELEESLRQRAGLPPRPDDVPPASDDPEPVPDAPPAATPPADEDGSDDDADDSEEVAGSLPATRLEAGQPPLRVGQVAAVLGVSKRYVQKLLEAGAVKAETVPGGRERRVPVAEVRRLRREGV